MHHLLASARGGLMSDNDLDSGPIGGLIATLMALLILVIA